MMAQAPCFVDVAAPITKSMPPALAQTSCGANAQLASSAMHGRKGQTLSSFPCGLSGTLASMVVVVKASRRRAARPKRIQMLVAGTVSMDEYVLQGESSAASPAGPKATSQDASLEAYLKLPVKEYTFVPMAYGASLTSKGQGNQFEVTVPTLDFGEFKIEPVATVCVKHGSDGSSCIVVEGDKVELRGAPQDMSDAVKNATFKLRLEVGYNDKADGQELTTKGSVLLGMDGTGIPLPKPIFESVGNGAMGMALSTLMSGFAQSFAEDYSNWSKDAAFRSDRAQTAGSK